MDKKEEILVHSAKVFMAYGFKSVTMDDLARELGVSKKTIYQYFKDKNELIETLIRLNLEADKTMCAQIKSFADNAIESMMKVIKKIGENMNGVHPSIFYDLQKYHPKSWKLIDEHQKKFVTQLLLDNVERGRSEGLYRLDFDAEIVAKMYVKCTDAVVKKEIESATHNDFAHALKEVIHFMIVGMATPKGLEYLNKQIQND
jgi:AcrR family transcriptional regulator